jgi:hypothetical protein
VEASTGESIGITGSRWPPWATGAWAYTIGAPALLPRDRRTDSSPSLISISARFDSSSNSMSFLSLRRSMDGLSWNTGVAESGQAAGGRRRSAASSA